MGQNEIIQVLTNEREFNNNSFLSPKEIQKALKNIGYIIRIENINKSIRKIRRTNIIEVDNNNKYNKAYRLKTKHIDI